ncbi:2OG-Fe(II) oxygenase [Novosphingopyxis sp. YJ-S2-01]|uniref:2OG-Fe(II) oxygenase n=1 Tax=Novosphingopyxis sp. YJ-S2-01 TaxID=2794021 RepID=UPI0018DDE20C|nr:2OG-Fe(II) oxygenase family protein [Novosphingopyxis sp. YJ-S2-01]MBH9536359.1 2OG-Fe(II) oxygenase [Novosphingopyxis sp. YJ-S2-01]
MFELHDDIDVDRLAAQYKRQGHVRIAPFLADDGAEKIFGELRVREDWRQMINSGEQLVELDRATRSAMSDVQSAALDEAVYAGARYDFQFRYEAIRVPDKDEERRACVDCLSEFAHFLSMGAARDALRRITAVPSIRFADAQATAYSPGDFLTGHDDAVAGKKRRAAYVLGLNPIWRPEWGGLLLLQDREYEALALTPLINCLNVFAVPRLHSVSEVSKAAPIRRYSITGWLRE